MSALTGDLTWGDIARWESFEDEPEGWDEPCEGGCGELLRDCTCDDEPGFCQTCGREFT